MLDIFRDSAKKCAKFWGENYDDKSAKFWWLPNLICTSEEEVCESLENAKRSGLGKSPTGEENTELHVFPELKLCQRFSNSVRNKGFLDFYEN